MARSPATRHDRPFRNADRGPGYTYRPDTRAPSIHGEHQPGIATPQLDHLVLASYDFDGGREELRELLERWSKTAEERMRERPGELTITIGLGPALFGGGELARERPAALHSLPPFRGDALDPAYTGGDLCVLAAASEPDAAAAALPEPTARWTQHAFLRRDPRDPPRGRPRDPLGFRDGTHNLRRPRDLDRHVWTQAGERSWMVGGTYLVVRRIEIDTTRWSRLPLEAQERTIGRHKHSGAPLGQAHEFDPMRMDPLDAPDPRPAADAHVRVAAPATNGGATMLRRGYSYADDSGSGLLFLSFQRDPRRQFVPVQRRLAERDALTPFLRHVGSAVFAIPPGAGPSGFVGDRLRVHSSGNL